MNPNELRFQHRLRKSQYRDSDLKKDGASKLCSFVLCGMYRVFCDVPSSCSVEHIDDNDGIHLFTEIGKIQERELRKPHRLGRLVDELTQTTLKGYSMGVVESHDDAIMFSMTVPGITLQSQRRFDSFINTFSGYVWALRKQFVDLRFLQRKHRVLKKKNIPSTSIASLPKSTGPKAPTKKQKRANADFLRTFHKLTAKEEQQEQRRRKSSSEIEIRKTTGTPRRHNFLRTRSLPNSIAAAVAAVVSSKSTTRKRPVEFVPTHGGGRLLPPRMPPATISAGSNNMKRLQQKRNNKTVLPNSRKQLCGQSLTRRPKATPRITVGKQRSDVWSS